MAGGDGPPIGALLAFDIGGGGDQPESPLLVRGGLWRQGDGEAAAEAVVSQFEVFQEDAPGDGVNDEVMDDEEESGAERSEVEEGDLKEAAAVEAEAGLEVGGGALKGDELGLEVERREVEEVKGRRREGERDGLEPETVEEREGGAKEVVMAEEESERGEKSERVEG